MKNIDFCSFLKQDRISQWGESEVLKRTKQTSCILQKKTAFTKKKTVLFLIIPKLLLIIKSTYLFSIYTKSFSHNERKTEPYVKYVKISLFSFTSLVHNSETHLKRLNVVLVRSYKICYYKKRTHHYDAFCLWLLNLYRDWFKMEIIIKAVKSDRYL